MEVSIFLAKILGAPFLVFGVGMLFNQSYYHKVFTQALNSPFLILLEGFCDLIIGLILVLSHNIWQQSWVVIITIMGWLTLMKGVFLIVCPGAVTEIAHATLKSKNFILTAGVLSTLFGAVLCYFGFLN